MLLHSTVQVLACSLYKFVLPGISSLEIPKNFVLNFYWYNRFGNGVEVISIIIALQTLNLSPRVFKSIVMLILHTSYNYQGCCKHFAHCIALLA